jgi:hypothetical protein
MHGGGDGIEAATAPRGARDRLLSLFGFTNGLGSGNSKNAATPRARP